DDPGTNANGVANTLWVFPFTGTPGASPNKAADKLPEETGFTSPAWKTGLAAINGGNEVVFIANTDGRGFAFAYNTTGGADKPQLWPNKFGVLGPSFSLGPT